MTMIPQAVQALSFIATMVVVPPLALGTVRKIKARLQNRIGAPIHQPFLDLMRLFQKSETVSETTSWVFRACAMINFAGMIVLAFLVPWVSYKPAITSDDLFLVVYLFALCRFFTVLSALDAGSVFGGFGASREVTLSLLVEPAVVLSLVSLGVMAKSTDLGVIFSYGSGAAAGATTGGAVLWLISGAGLFLASLVELSRMPADDPTTHLELTMVHEAMILENSGRNLALTEYAHWLKLTMLLGLCGQCFLHAICTVWHPRAVALGVLSLFLLLVMLKLIAVIESNTVKLRWTKVPEFIAYSVAMGLLGMLIAVGSR